MDALHTLYAEITGWLYDLRDPAAWAQIGVVAVAALLARIVNQTLDSLFDGADTGAGLRHVARRTAQRIVFPLSMLAGVLLGRAALQALEQPVTLLHAAIPLLLSLAAIRIAIYALRKVLAPSTVLKASEGIVSTGAWSLVALHFLGWLQPLLSAMDEIAFELGSVRVSLLSASKMLLLLAALMTAALWIAALIERKLKQVTHLDAGLQVGLAKFIRFFLYGLAILLALNTVGIDFTAFAVFGGALGVGLGFGLQRIASNFISGFILIMDRSIRPGDVITVGQTYGWVQELRARYVVVRNRDGVETLIPNESLVTSEVINWTYSDRKVRVRIPVQISYEDDPELAMRLMIEAAHACERVVKEPAPSCRLTEFADSGLQLELRVWIDDPEGGVGSIRSDLSLAMFKAFREHGITIPYPHRELYLKQWPLALTERTNRRTGTDD